MNTSTVIIKTNMNTSYIGMDMWMTYYSYTKETYDKYIKPAHKQHTPSNKLCTRNRTKLHNKPPRPNHNNKKYKKHRKSITTVSSKYRTSNQPTEHKHATYPLCPALSTISLKGCTLIKI